jgi:orotidine-5'-phosphate decarboxylase
MAIRNFMELLRAKWAEHKFVCVGLDSDAAKLPVQHLGMHDIKRLMSAQRHYIRLQELLASTPEERQKVNPLGAEERRLLAYAQLAFNKRIIDVTKDIVCAYKPNSAFYEALGDAGLNTLEETILYINKAAPDVPVILDCKRGDIDNTNLGYVMAANLADAVTVHPYLGWQAMKPFLAQKDKGVFVLVKTSNKGAAEFQDLDVPFGYHADSGEQKTAPLYQRVAMHVASPHAWNYNGNCGVVAGATYPKDVAKIRQIVGNDMPMLLPGIGAQGGPHEEAVRAAVNSRGSCILINDSRKSIFASSGTGFADACRERVITLNQTNTAVLATV